MGRYRNRDPRPQTRDPIPENAAVVDKHEETTQESAPPPPLPHALTLNVPSVKCSRCGGAKFHRCNATRPSVTSERMTRRKQCYTCGQWYVFQSEPTTQERAKYWPQT